MDRGDIKPGTRRRLLIAAPGAAALVLATREQGSAKSSLAKLRKRRKAREKPAALDAVSTDLAALDPPITMLQGLANDYRDHVVGGEDLAADLQAIVDDLRIAHTDLGDNLAIARGEVPST